LLSERLSHIIKGESMSLYKNGKIKKDNLDTALMTKNDLMGDLRLRGQVQTLREVEEVVMETSGEVSVIKKKAPRPLKGKLLINLLAIAPIEA
jgi:uncharacterized membrane protein YcaP (DUF421 family)